jgi:hypothetical protein
MMPDNKITALTEDTAPLTTDLVMTVDDPAGTPINKKVTIANLLRNKADAIIAVTQASHGFVAGDALYCSGANAYTKANAAAAATSDVVGVVAVNVGVNDFTLCTSGKMTTGVPAVAAGSVLFLSDATAGLLTATEPTTVGHISLPIAIVTENAVSMIVYLWRGAEIAATIFASTAETTTGTSTTLAVTPNGLADSLYGRRLMGWKVFDDATAVATGDGKVIWSVPPELNGMNLVSVFASVSTVSSSGDPAISIENLTDTTVMLSALLTIDATEYSSDSDAHVAVIDTTKDDVVTGDRLEINVDTAGTGTKGLFVVLGFALP